MYRSSEPTPPRRSPAGFGLAQFDPAAVYEWFGAPFAMLVTPDSHTRHVVGRFSDTAAGSRQGTTPQPDALQPVYITIRHILAGDRPVDVSTRRLHGLDATTAHRHLWQTVVDYQLLAAGSANVDWPEGLPPADIQARLDLTRPLPVTATQTLSVNGVAAQWGGITDRDLASGQKIVAFGARVGRELVAVVGPEDALTVAAIEVWPDAPEPGQT